LNESHPRSGGPPWVRYRREAEDVLCEAGAAILHLPDFYGPYVHVSTLQNALNEAASGKTVNWLGSADTQREYIYVPDAMRIAAAVGARTKASAQRSTSGRDRRALSREAGQAALGRDDDAANCKSVQQGFARAAAGCPRLYEKPVNYDERKLLRLLGPQRMTSYADGIGNTLAWIASR